MLSFLLLISTVFADSKSDASLAAIVKSLKPETVAFEFVGQPPPLDAEVVTFVSGVGHMPSDLTLTTLRKIDGKVNIFQVKYSAVHRKESTQFENFFYQIAVGRMKPARFSALIKELAKLHAMKTFKEYKISSVSPIGFGGEQKTELATSFGGASMSSVNYAHLVNVWARNNSGFRYGFSGYDGSEARETALKVDAMSALIEKYLATEKLTSVAEVTAQFAEYFQHQRNVMGLYDGDKDWWWVKERTEALSRVFEVKP